MKAMQEIQRILVDIVAAHFWIWTSTLNNSHMKYILNKDLPTFKAGTEAWLSKRGNLLTKIDGKEITMYSHSTLAKFPNILTEWFEPIEEKRKAVPDVWDNYFVIPSYWEVSLVVNSKHSTPTINQGNWRWTQEEAELEVKKRAAIERVRRYLVSNDLLEEDEKKDYYHLYLHEVSILPFSSKSYKFYSPYGRIKYTNLDMFIEDCREDLLMIHS